MELPKAVLTSNSVTIKSWRVLKDKIAGSVGREWSGAYSNRNQRQFADNYQITRRRFSENFQIFSGNVLSLILTKLGFELYFISFSKISRQLSENSPTTSWWLYNKALINQLFVPHGKYSDFIFCMDLISVKTAVRVFCGMDLTIG